MLPIELLNCKGVRSVYRAVGYRCQYRPLSRFALRPKTAKCSTEGLRRPSSGNSDALCRFYQISSKTCAFIVRDRPGLLEPVEFFNFVRYAETDHISKLFAGVLNPLDPPFGHAF